MCKICGINTYYVFYPFFLRTFRFRQKSSILYLSVAILPNYLCSFQVVPTHYTQNSGGGKASVYKLGDYRAVQRCLKSCRGIEIDDIPWGTFNVIEKLSNSVTAGRWIPCRPEHLPDEKVDELIERLPKLLVQSLLPFQYEGVQFGLRRGGRCLIADEMGLGKTLQVSFRK